MGKGQIFCRRRGDFFTTKKVGYQNVYKVKLFEREIFLYDTDDFERSLSVIDNR